MALDRRSRCLLAALLCGFAGAASAQTEELQPVGPFAEVFLESPKVSGNLLVGLRWAAEPGRFDPQGVRLQTPLRGGAGQVCVDVASKDGRYTAENLYPIPRQATGAARVAAPTRYSDRLGGYPVDDIAVIIHAAASCDAANARVVIPATLATSGGQAAPGRRLVAYVNADAARTGLSLIGEREQDVATGSCQGASGGVQIAFSAVCTVEVPTPPPGPLRLRLSVKERFKTVPTDYTLLLP